MFPWSDHCLYERVRRRRRLGEEQDVLDKWTEDVCSGEELPEVEIISLVEEQIPKYKLRADTLTSFTGYENQDWFIQDPALRVEDTSPLTPEQIRETLNYFLLCSTRVSQMTKTYNDIEAVTRLLEEKEKDIELTARIGKELLAHNSKLESNVASLENELRLCNEKITQLSHELIKKSELIQILTNDVEDSGSEAGTPTSGKPGSAHFEILQKRIGMLENENAGLRVEASRLAAQTEDSEEQEARLVADLVAQLEACRNDLGSRGLEAERNRLKENELKEQIEHLQAKLQTSNEKLAETLKENEDYLAMLTLSRETQCELATELADLKEKYAEVLSVLEELRENMRKSKKKNQPTARAGPLYPSLHTSVQIKNPDSLAAELECSLFSELSLDSGIGGASTTNIPNYKKVFETVRCASRASSLNSGEPSSTSSPAPRLGGTCITPSSAFASTASRPRTSSYVPMPYDVSSVSDSEEITVMAKVGSGVGSVSTPENLEMALKRLTPAAIDARRAALASGVAGSSPFNFDMECPTPDSIMSTGSSNYTPWKLPDKLQIVKPLEGSLTLHHWSELATPSLGGLLDERPGVKIRGGTDLEDLGLQMYSLCDVEEDDDINPGKSFQDTSHIYTYTNSTVMHPDDCTNVTSSIRGTQMCISTTSSRMSSMCPTPVTRSRRNSTSTFSTTPGLAALLNERGIRAVTPSALVTPEYTPTATPCNSPARSPSPTEDDESYSSLGLPGFLMTSGAEMLRRALGSAMKSPTAVRSSVLGSTPPTKSPIALARPDKKAALTGIRLVEKLERIGIEEILATTTASTSTGGGTTLHQAAIKRTPLKSQGGAILGVPGRPGRGELDARLSQLPAGGQSRRGGSGRMGGGERQVRPDLGHVPGQAPNNVRQPHPQPQPPQSPTTAPTTLGTLSSLLFGRKGGLL